MCGAQQPTPRGVLMHVRLHVSQQSIAVERYVIVHSAGGPCKAVRVKVRVVAQLGALWRQCAAPHPHGKAVAPSAVLDSCWVRSGASTGVAPPEPQDPGAAAAAESTHAEGLLVALDTKILKLEPFVGASHPGRPDLMGTRTEQWRALVLDLPVTIVPPPPSKWSPGVSFAGRALWSALQTRFALPLPPCRHVCGSRVLPGKTKSHIARSRWAV